MDVCISITCVALYICNTLYKMNNPIQPRKLYALRRIENLHIFLWLIKDTCWAMVWKPGGIIMIVPTVSVAFYLLYHSRNSRTELFHNVAVCMWILANSTWMIGEFMNKDLRAAAVGLFAIGLFTLVIYYALFYVKDMQAEIQEE